MEEKKYCPKCGREYDTNLKFCTACGCELAKKIDLNKDKNKTSVNKPVIAVIAGLFVVMLIVIACFVAVKGTGKTSKTDKQNSVNYEKESDKKTSLEEDESADVNVDDDKKSEDSKSSDETKTQEVFTGYAVKAENEESNNTNASTEAVAEEVDNYYALFGEKATAISEINENPLLSMTYDEIKAEEESIRTKVNSGVATKVVVSSKDDGSSDSKWFCFDTDGQLIFSFWFDNTGDIPERRFYFKDGYLIELIYGDNAGAGQPDPRVYRYLSDWYGATPDAGWYDIQEHVKDCALPYRP